MSIETAVRENPIKRQTSLYEIDYTKMDIDDRYFDIQHLTSTICSAKDRNSNERTVIIKKLPRIFDAKEDAKKAYREIRILKFVSHDNISQLLDVFANSDIPRDFNDVYLVTNYMNTNLANVIRDHVLNTENIKKITYQLLRGLKYLHSCDIIHRDLKPENIALNDEFDVRITDFGLARAKNDEMTGYVATRRYRAPELLLLARDDIFYIRYTEAIDIWAVGCILAEMYKKQQLFKEAQNPLWHLKLILNLTGLPSDACLDRLGPDYKEFFQKYKHEIQPVDFRTFFNYVTSDEAADLLKSMLKFDCEERISYVDALKSQFFAGLHDLDDEPTGMERLQDTFSNQEHQIADWKTEILHEIGTFHPPT